MAIMIDSLRFSATSNVNAYYMYLKRDFNIWKNFHLKIVADQINDDNMQIRFLVCLGLLNVYRATNMQYA